MDFDLTERQAFYRDRVRDFIETRIRPRSKDYKSQLEAGDRWQPIDARQTPEQIQPQVLEVVEARLKTSGIPPAVTASQKRRTRPANSRS